VFGEPWDSIAGKLQEEESVWEVWWVDGVNRHFQLSHPKTYAILTSE